MGLFEFFVPYYKRKFADGIVIVMNVNYLFTHLDPKYRREVAGITNDFEDVRSINAFKTWRYNKVSRTIKSLKNTNPLSIKPISVNIASNREVFTINNGMSRLCAFRIVGLKKIKVELYHGF